MTRPHNKRPPRRKPLDPARGAAFDVLRAVSERDAYANLALPALLRERGITGRDAAFATELAYGTCRTRGLLDAIIGAAAGRPPENIDPVLLDLLRLGAYQLLRTRVEPHAAVSTTVEQAGIEFDSARAGFVNGVLRAIARRDERSWVEEFAPPADSDPVGHNAFVHAHPRWVAQAFADALGADAGQLDALLASDDERPSVHLAARPGVLTADELAGRVDGTVGRYSPYAVYLAGGDPGRLEAVRDGAALVQDEGSQLVARALTLADLDGPDAGRWLDLCSGPGGKTALLAALGTAAQVTAIEPNPRRAEMVEENTRGLPVEVLRVDGREPGIDAGFDRVLVDAPCSGLGVLAARPDLRWRAEPLPELQAQLLRVAAERVKAGGTIVYSVCTINSEENEAVVDASGLRALPLGDEWPQFRHPRRPEFLLTLPHVHGTSGFFIARLQT
jgi:16S rRNA (cytosine967-C5)-methyltransferase